MELAVEVEAPSERPLAREQARRFLCLLDAQVGRVVGGSPNGG